MGEERRVRLNEVAEQYRAIGEKYGLSEEEVEYLFNLALMEHFGTEDIEFVGEGVRVAGGNYKNIKYSYFKKIIDTFDKLCLDSASKRIKSYLDGVLIEKNDILYGKILRRDDYEYVVQPLLSKDKEMKYMDPIVIESRGLEISERITKLPIEIIRSSGKPSSINTYRYKARLFNKRLARFHLDKLTLAMEENFKVATRLSVKKYFDATLVLANLTEGKLDPRIGSYVNNYFGRLGVKVVIPSGGRA